MANSSVESIGPMSLDTFYRRTKHALTNLVGIGLSLQSVHQLCLDQENLDLESCQCIFRLIELLNEPVQVLCHLLRNRHQLPSDVISLRYPLEVSVFYTDEQLHILTHLVEQYLS